MGARMYEPLRAGAGSEERARAAEPVAPGHCALALTSAQILNPLLHGGCQSPAESGAVDRDATRGKDERRRLALDSPEAAPTAANFLRIVLALVAIVGLAAFPIVRALQGRAGAEPSPLGPPVTVATSPECTAGPSFWCQQPAPGSSPAFPNIAACELQGYGPLGVCRYSSHPCPTVPNLEAFCANVAGALKFDGGITGLPPGETGYYTIGTYWPPSSCCPGSNPRPGGFCSNYTYAGTPAASTMQLHGLWPDFGYPGAEHWHPKGTLQTHPAGSSPVLEPGSEGGEGKAAAHQGWAMYCRPDPRVPGAPDAYPCHVNGGLCPEGPLYNQWEYVACLRRHNVTQCLVEEEVVQGLYEDFAEFGAGFLAEDRGFLDHEWFKHGSCMTGMLGYDKLLYFSLALKWARRLRDPAHPDGAAAVFVQANRGRSVAPSALTSLLQGKGVPRCNWECQLSEIWYCAKRDVYGEVEELTECPMGTLVADNCSPGKANSRHCTSIEIPDFEVGPSPKTC